MIKELKLSFIQLSKYFQRSFFYSINIRVIRSFLQNLAFLSPHKLCQVLQKRCATRCNKGPKRRCKILQMFCCDPISHSLSSQQKGEETHFSITFWWTLENWIIFPKYGRNYSPIMIAYLKRIQFHKHCSCSSSCLLLGNLKIFRRVAIC